MRTYWIYYGGRPVASVRLSDGATADAVKRAALRGLYLVGGTAEDAPIARHAFITFGTVYTSRPGAN